MGYKMWVLVAGSPPGRRTVRGFGQRQGVDYSETFASVVNPRSHKAIFAVVPANDWDLGQIDIKTACKTVHHLPF